MGSQRHSFGPNKKMFFLDRPFQQRIEHPKQSLYAKVMPPGS